MAFLQFFQKENYSFITDEQGQMPITCGGNAPVTLTLSYFMFD